MLRAEIVCPEFEFVVENEGEVIVAMATYELEAVKSRLRRGISASGAAFPKPKDGGEPLNRSHQLIEGIDKKIFRVGKSIVATIEPMGDRNDARDRLASKRRRVGAARKLHAESLRAAGADEDLIKRETKRIRGRRVRTTNMDVAAILAYAPKDLRAQRGSRGVYDLFATTEEEKRRLAQIAANTAVVALVEKGSGARHRGRGVVDD